MTIQASLLLPALLTVASCTSNETCPTWLYRSEEGWCTCGSSLLNVITCNNDTGEVGVQSSFCLTSSHSRQHPTEAVVGTCVFGQHHGRATEGGAGLYVRVAPNISDQDKQLCDYLNREGRLCGACQPHHFVSAYSYDLKCYKCYTGLLGNILAYIAVGYLLQTFFLVAVVLLRISFTSPHYSVAILLCQIWATPESQRVLTQNLRNTPFMIPYQIIATFYGVLNLDFFRAVVPTICLPLNTMQVMALDYLTAIYPLLLLVGCYVLVSAHDRGFGPVVRLWGPFFRWTVRTRHKFNIKHSIIDAFAAFFLLSYMKLVYTSIDLLIFTSVVDIHGSRVGHVLYYDATVDFLGAQHRPYAILAMAVLAAGLLFPALLILYPTNWFQRSLNKVRLNSPGLRSFVECFQGNYRDRTDGGLECRYFSAVYPFYRFVGSTLYAATRNSLFFPAMLLFVILTIGTLIMLRPYKKQYDMYNSLDAFLWLSVAGFIAGYLMYALSFDWYKLPPVFGTVVAGIFTLTPLVYFIVLAFCFVKKSLLKRSCTGILERSDSEVSSEINFLLDPSTNTRNSTH